MSIIDTTFPDVQRAGRAAVAMLDGDPEAFAAALADAVEDQRPGSTGRLVHAVLELACDVLVAYAGGREEAAGILRQSLATLTLEALARGDHDG